MAGAEFAQYLEGSQTRTQALTGASGLTVIRTSFTNLSPVDAETLCSAMRRAGRDCLVR